MKDGKFKYSTWFGIIFTILIFIIIFGLLIIFNLNYEEEVNKICIEHGSKEYYAINGQTYCRDYEGNLQYFYFNCTNHNIINYTCTGNPISIGDLRKDE